MNDATSSLDASRIRLWAGVAHMTSLNGPIGDTGQWPLTNRCPLWKPAELMDPSTIR